MSIQEEIIPGIPIEFGLFLEGNHQLSKKMLNYISLRHTIEQIDEIFKRMIDKSIH